MKLDDSNRITGPGRLSAADKKARVGAAAYAKAADAASKAPSVSDMAAVLDIPEAEFSPKVRAAILGLMAEVDRMRRELQQSQARIAHLEQLAGC